MNLPGTTIDSHQHFWRLDRGDYDWLTPALAPIYRDYLPADLEPQLAQANVGATILVQAAASVEETRFLLALAREHDFIKGVVGWADFEDANVALIIADLATDPTLVGLRPMIQDIPDTEWMLAEKLAPAFEAMIDQGLVFDALVLPRHLPALIELSARYPDLPMVLDHGAKPPIAGGDLTSWKLKITELAGSSHMVCKLSGLVTEAGSAHSAALEAAVDHLLGAFGPARMMWGSDWPVCERVCSYGEWRRVTHTLLTKLSATEREHIYSGTARATYGI